VAVMTETLATSLASQKTEADKEKLAKRQANAAVTLLRTEQPKNAWPFLQHCADPRARSYLIHRLAPLGTDVSVLVKRLDAEPDATIRRALILSLGEFGEAAWPAEQRGVLVQKLQEIYGTAADAGLHAAAEWLLRHWQEEGWLRQTNESWAKDKAMQVNRLEEIQKLLAKENGKAAPQWYVNGQGQTMIVIPGPAEFVMGSPPTEEGRQEVEHQHRKRIGRTYALAATPLTKEQFLRYVPKFRSDIRN
jgi:formylglycine-generating enzyme required for sulfatase activity